MELLDFSGLAGHAIEFITMIVGLIISWVGMWARSKFKSDIMKTTMERLTETVKAGAMHAIQSQESYVKGKMVFNKPKNMIVGMALQYVEDNSVDLIEASGYSREKIRRMIEARLPQIALDHEEVDMGVGFGELNEVAETPNR